MQNLGIRIWEEWPGMEIPGLGINDPDDLEGKILYYAPGYWGLDDEDVMIGLARTIQQDGVGLNLSDSFRLVESAQLHHGYAAPTDEELDESSLVETDDDGRCLRYGYPVAHALPVQVTWALIPSED